MQNSLKKCANCKMFFERLLFNKNSYRKDGLQNRCRECDKIYQKKWFDANKERRLKCVKINNKKYYIKNHLAILEYFKAHPCLDCGETDPVVLEFDHRDPSIKEFNISVMKKSTTTERLFLEIEKCDVRCCNCHRRKTAKQFDWNNLDK